MRNKLIGYIKLIDLTKFISNFYVLLKKYSTCGCNVTEYHGCEKKKCYRNASRAGLKDHVVHFMCNLCSLLYTHT